MPRANRRKAETQPVTLETVRQLALALPAVEEGTSYDTPAFKVRGKLFVRLHQDGDAIVVGIGQDERAARMKADPRTFFITDHYLLRYDWMLVRLASVEMDDLREVIEESWRRSAPPRLVADFESNRQTRGSE